MYLGAQSTLGDTGSLKPLTLWPPDLHRIVYALVQSLEIL